MIEPSIELITEILRMYPQYSKSDFCTGNIQVKSNVIHFEVNKSYMTQLNIHEFTYQCKEFAYSKDFLLLSGRYLYNGQKDDTVSCIINYNVIYEDNGEKIKESTSYFQSIEEYTNEYEAVTKACEWILQQIKDNK